MDTTESKIIAEKKTNDIIDELIERSKNYLSNSIAVNTKEAYVKDFRSFDVFCKEHDLTALPSNPETVMIWITHCAKIGKRTTTISRALTSISQVHKAANFENPINDIVRKTMSGITRSDTRAKRKATPINKKTLIRLIENIRCDIIGIRNRALLLIGWAGAFRRSELVNLNLEDIDLVDDGVIINISCSKTDQAGEGYKIGIPFATDEKLCPVSALVRWLEMSEIKKGAIFRQLGPGARNRLWERCGGRLTSKSVSRIIKRLAAESGYYSETYSGHSLRAGFITEAAAAGVSERIIMRHTRHRSIPIMRGYIHDSTLFKSNPLSSLL
jgi:site-specific recombinase XerD